MTYEFSRYSGYILQVIIIIIHEYYYGGAVALLLQNHLTMVRWTSRNCLHQILEEFVYQKFIQNCSFLT